MNGCTTKSEPDERLHLWEVIGVAGSGKSTLCRRVYEKTDSFISKPSLKRIQLVPVWACALARSVFIYFRKKADSKTLASMPLHVKVIRHQRLFLLREILMIAYLQVSIAELKKRRVTQKFGLVMDQGPVYLIAALCVYGATVERPLVECLIYSCLSELKRLVSGIIFLNVPLVDLSERWEKREDWDEYLKLFGTQALILAHHEEFLKIYRWLAQEFKQNDQTNLITIESKNFDVEQFVDQIISRSEAN